MSGEKFKPSIAILDPVTYSIDLKVEDGGLFKDIEALFGAVNHVHERPQIGPSHISAEERALRSRVEKFFLKTKLSTAWDEIVGNEAGVAALVETIEHPVKHKELFAHYGRKPAKGVLLYGPPGCGKTMMGKAAAAAIARVYKSEDVPLIKINGPEIQSPYVGETERIIRDIFAYARAFAKRTGRPIVIFIDEADSILPSRDGAGGRRPHSYEESQVATFLTEMDGIETSGAFVILATNRPHAIDAAILRDGRCDRKIKVVRPDRQATEILLRRALASVPSAHEASELAAHAAAAVFDPGLVLAEIHHEDGETLLTFGDIVNGAMVGGIIERAKAIAFERDLAAGDKTGITPSDIESAVEVVFAENVRLHHLAAVDDLAEARGLRWKSVEPVQRRSEPQFDFFWMSFSDPSRPSGQRNLGCTIVKANTARAALKASHHLGVNPGGEVELVGFNDDGTVNGDHLAFMLNTLRSREEMIQAGIIDAETKVA